jgi:2'-5' RNA ligase
MEQKTTPQNNVRLFFAIPLPTAEHEKLAKLKTRIPELERRPLQNLHVTLRFLGNLDPELLPAIKEATSQIITKNRHKFTPFFLSTKVISVFRKKPPTPLVIPIRFSPPLMQLKDILDEGLKTVSGLNIKEGLYRPHITLARLNRPFSQNLQRCLKKSPPESTLRFRADKFFLYESVLDPEAARHTVISSYSLAKVYS